MKRLTAILAACLIGWAARAVDSSAAPVFQMRLVLDAPSGDTEQMTLSNSVTSVEKFNVQKTVLLDQTALKSAKMQMDLLGHPTIAITFNEDGRKQFSKISRENIGKRIVIIIAGRPSCAPMIRTEISGGQAVISGSFSKDEAKELAKKINEAVAKK